LAYQHLFIHGTSHKPDRGGSNPHWCVFTHLKLAESPEWWQHCWSEWQIPWCRLDVFRHTMRVCFTSITSSLVSLEAEKKPSPQYDATSVGLWEQHLLCLVSTLWLNCSIYIPLNQMFSDTLWQTPRRLSCTIMRKCSCVDIHSFNHPIFIPCLSYSWTWGDWSIFQLSLDRVHPRQTIRGAHSTIKGFFSEMLLMPMQLVQNSFHLSIIEAARGHFQAKLSWMFA